MGEDLEAFASVQDRGPALDCAQLRNRLVSKPNERRLGLVAIRFLHCKSHVFLGDGVLTGLGELLAHISVEIVAEVVESVVATRLLHELCHVGLVKDPVYDRLLDAGASAEAVEESGAEVDDALLRFLLAER